MKRLLLLLMLGIAGLSITACDPLNRIDSLHVAYSPHEPALDAPIDHWVRGWGTSTKLNVDWGDGRTDPYYNVALSLAPPYLTHTYSGWAGGKTVTVTGVAGCLGTARTRFKIEPSTWKIGWARDPNGDTRTCVPVPGKPSLAPNSLVKITSPPTPYVKFAYAFDARKFDADGNPGTVAAAPFPFPGFREFSLVLRVGSSLFQGGKSAQFVSTTGGVLELCQNDFDTKDNTGGWEIDIEVDQLGP